MSDLVTTEENKSIGSSLSTSPNVGRVCALILTRRIKGQLEVAHGGGELVQQWRCVRVVSLLTQVFGVP
jgi:hypothetical protein